VIDAVAEMDLAGFYASYRADGHGRAAHDPAMMVALLLYVYSIGERSSRRIERRCVEDVAARVICANQRPDHTTIARFRQRHETALAGLFGEVLALCAEAGMVQVGVVAIDGTKLHANASQHATRSYEDIAREILAETDAVDAGEDERFGAARGDELPPELATAQGRRGWLREAKRRLDDKRAEEARPIPRSRPDRLREARRRLEEEHRTACQANAAYEAYRARGRMKDGRRFGRPPDPFQPPLVPTGKINLSPDFGHLVPMVEATGRELAAAGITAAPEVVLADAGYWHQAQMESLRGSGTVVLIPPDAGKRKGARPGWDGGLFAFMRRVLASDRGSELYAKRQGMIEPVFAHTKFNRRMDRFQRRGRSAARSEWRLMTATHNLLKLYKHTTAPLAA
jgi:transposase